MSTQLFCSILLISPQIVEKLEITVHEYHIKIEDLNRTVVDMNSQKQKLQMESQEVSQTNDCIFLEKVY